jgi:hypothetical protein
MLLTTDVLALVGKRWSGRSVRFRPGLFCCLQFPENNDKRPAEILKQAVWLEHFLF